MGTYGDFSSVYDVLMQNAEYGRRTKYLLKLFSRFGKKPQLLLDLACGTGGFSIPLAESGVEVIGVDMSEEMLSVARQNAAEKGVDVLFLCQKAEELDLYGTVDSAICCMDGINHIIKPSDLKKVFERVSLFLEPGSLFIFDVNTPYKHECVLGNNTFSFEEEGIVCVWKNGLNREKLLTEISLDFFVPVPDGLYERKSEHFFEKAYTVSELKNMLESAGLETEAVFDDLSFDEPTEKSERLFFVTRKP